MSLVFVLGSKFYVPSLLGGNSLDRPRIRWTVHSNQRGTSTYHACVDTVRLVQFGEALRRKRWEVRCLTEASCAYMADVKTYQCLLHNRCYTAVLIAVERSGRHCLSPLALAT